MHSPTHDSNGLLLRDSSDNAPAVSVSDLPTLTLNCVTARSNGAGALARAGLPPCDVSQALEAALHTPAHLITRDNSITPGDTCSSTPALYLGSLEAATDVALLRRLGVKRIVNCLSEGEAAPEVLHSEGEFEVLSLALEDEEDAGISHMTLEVLERAVAFLDAPAADGTPAPPGSLPCTTLVHCQAGVSRSAAVVVAYLLSHRLYSTAAEALAHVQRCRPIADPNLGFRRLLFLLERKLAGATAEELTAWSAELTRAAAALKAEEAAAYSPPPLARRASVCFSPPETPSEGGEGSPTAAKDAMRRRRSLRRTSALVEEIRAAAAAAAAAEAAAAAATAASSEEAQ